MWVFVRGENIDPNSEMRLVFETDGATKPYRQFATLGGHSLATAPTRNGAWAATRFRSEDLPLDSRGTMRIKFELIGPGEVWIDNVQLYDLLFPLQFLRAERAGEARTGETKNRDGRCIGKRPVRRVRAKTGRLLAAVLERLFASRSTSDRHAAAGAAECPARGGTRTEQRGAESRQPLVRILEALTAC